MSAVLSRDQNHGRRLSAVPVTGSPSIQDTDASAAAAPQLHSRKPKFTIITRFQKNHGWQSSSGRSAAVRMDDPTDFTLGKQSLTLTTDRSGAGVRIDSPTYRFPIDLQGKIIRVLLKVDGLPRLETLRLYAGDGGFENHRNFDLDLREARVAASYLKEGEWTWVTLNASAGSLVGRSHHAVTNWRFTATSRPGSTVTIHLNALEFATPPRTFPRGAVSICFDDGRLSPFLNARPALDDYGWAASLYPIVDRVAETPGGTYMTTSQLRQCRDISGWEVGVHSYTRRDHDAGFDALTPAQIRSNISAARRWVQNNHLGLGAGLAWPLGAFSTAAADAAETLCSYGRLNTTASLETWPPQNLMRIRSAANSESFTKVRQMIDQTTDSRGWLCLTFHEITPRGTESLSCSVRTFRRIVDYVADKELAVLPVIDVLREGAQR
ncbi:polysaccharide deacetylase family protein [Knoellia sp. p5-6-4]|uniref:polysaccharide deacetylase family protein n=1 Tax=unclassified Knoellia TaxID=2618719 RepID=UPI0023DC0372|nr:polysaccharide deacetylase family protein [Knoellia sp. p5-6-4]MDF2144476.1 polysaccharide deacetylase family protein [Knoellia sp. p5-6-4]